ncbi:hypothetical protein FF1_022438 [Malus domestica]
MELIDLGFSGPKFARQGTRNNSLVQERLDRGLVNGVWQERWPSSSIAHGTVWASDLSPLIVMNESKVRNAKPLFRFEAFWCKEPGCKETMEQSWNSRVDGQWMNKWQTKIHSTKKNLKSWSQETFKGRRNEIQALTAHLGGIVLAPKIPSLMAASRGCKYRVLSSINGATPMKKSDC